MLALDDNCLGESIQPHTLTRTHTHRHRLILLHLIQSCFFERAAGQEGGANEQIKKLMCAINTIQHFTNTYGFQVHYW